MKEKFLSREELKKELCNIIDNWEINKQEIIIPYDEIRDILKQSEIYNNYKLNKAKDKINELLESSITNFKEGINIFERNILKFENLKESFKNNNNYEELEDVFFDLENLYYEVFGEVDNITNS